MLISPLQVSFVASAEELKYCSTKDKTDDKGKSCCYDGHASDENSSEKQHCNETCDTICSGCSVIYIAGINPLQTEATPCVLVGREQKFPYLSPYILQSVQKIWKPPKILA